MPYDAAVLAKQGSEGPACRWGLFAREGLMADVETTKQLSSMRQTKAAGEYLHKGPLECAITLAAEGQLPETKTEYLFRLLQRLKPQENSTCSSPGSSTRPAPTRRRFPNLRPSLSSHEPFRNSWRCTRRHARNLMTSAHGQWLRGTCHWGTNATPSKNAASRYPYGPWRHAPRAHDV